MSASERLSTLSKAFNDVVKVRVVAMNAKASVTIPHILIGGHQSPLHEACGCVAIKPFFKMLFCLPRTVPTLKAYFFDDKGHVETLGTLRIPFCSLGFEG